MRRIVAPILALLAVSCSKDIDQVTLEGDSEKVVLAINSNETANEPHYQLSDSAVVDEADLLTSKESELIEYFKYLTLWKGPHVTEVEVNRRWNRSLRLYLDGSISDSYRSTVEKVIAEYNALFVESDFTIALTENIAEANGHLFFGEKEEMKPLWADMYDRIADGNYSGYAMTPSRNAVLHSTRIWISNPIASLFKHELGHALGLGHSNQCTDEKSIMCSKVGSQSDFSKAETRVLRYLYHRDFSAGLNASQIEKRLAELIISGR